MRRIRQSAAAVRMLSCGWAPNCGLFASMPSSFRGLTRLWNSTLFPLATLPRVRRGLKSSSLKSTERPKIGHGLSTATKLPYHKYNGERSSAVRASGE